MIGVFKAEIRRYLAELKTYYPDQITSVVITVLIFMVFTLMNSGKDDSAFYIGYAYWYLISELIGEASESVSFEKQMGTLDQLLLRPVGLEAILSIKTLVWMLINLIKVFGVIALLMLIFHLGLGFSLMIIPIFFVTCVGIFGFSLLLAGLTLKYTKTASFGSVVSYLFLFLTGSIVPITQLPEWVQFISKGLPITLGISCSRAAILTGSVPLGDFVLLCVQSIVFVAVGHVTFKLIYKSSKLKGIDNSY